MTDGVRSLWCWFISNQDVWPNGHGNVGSDSWECHRAGRKAEGEVVRQAVNATNID